MKNPTIREIAAACDVHASTVSRALASSSRIPAATRTRILEQAEKMGWKPNVLASAYMAHFRSTRLPHYQATLAFIIAAQTASTFDELPEYHRKVYTGAQDRAASLGYAVDVIWLREVGGDAVRLSRVLRSRGIVGVLLHGGSMLTRQMVTFRWDQFALATWGYSLRVPLHRAAFHGAHGLRLALSELRKKGYRRIALVMSELQNQLSDYGFLSALYFEANQHSQLQEWIRARVFAENDQADLELTRVWIQENQPDVIIGDQFALEILQELKWRVPKDVAFVSMFCSEAWPEIGGVDQCPDVIGANAMDLLAAKIVQNERGLPDAPKLVLSPGKWVDGPSVPVKGPMLFPDFQDPLDYVDLERDPAVSGS